MWIPIVFLALLMSTAFAEKVAIAYLSDPTGVNQVTGTVTFNKTDNGIIVVGEITGLPPGNHGFHVHNLGKIFPDCMESGAHFNPENNNHGAPNDTVRHVGDLGNIIALNNVSTSIDILDTVIALEGSHNIIGRALVIHEGEDDLGKGGNETSLTTGNAGGRMACGVIGILVDEPSSSTISTASFAVNIIVLVAYGLRSVLSF